VGILILTRGYSKQAVIVEGLGRDEGGWNLQEALRFYILETGRGFRPSEWIKA